jgi:hypothetical protein
MNRLNFLTPQTHAEGEYFKSTFALDFLTDIAQFKTEDEFCALMQPVFGSDIAPRTYAALHKALLTGDIHSPHITPMTGGQFVADYDNRDRIIRLNVEPLHVMLDQNDADIPIYLLVVLLHEFGHHIDNVLRQDLSDTHEQAGSTLRHDAAGEEGGRFALAMLDELSRLKPETLNPLLLHPDKPNELLIGHYSDAYYMTRPEAFSVDIQSVTRKGAAIHGQPGDGLKHRHPDREAFEAGSDDAHGHTHQTIGWALKDFNFKRAEIDAVYFGNWLRDYSQVVDPKITRPIDAPKEFPTVLSRQAWTDLVDILAVKKFPDLRMRFPAEMKVTTDTLGVYRPHEHIDNPLVVAPSIPDPRARDQDFEPWVLPGDPTLDADPATSMKHYISRSVEYMQQRLREAMTHGRSLTGLRSFGAALHVLEDLFAHSNFVELSLIKAGHVHVLPWTTPVQVKWNLPLVTGTFGGSDIIASLSAPLGKILFSTQELEFELTQPGYRSERDKVMLILLSEHPNQTFYGAFQALLSARDQLAVQAKRFGVDTVRFYRWLISTPAGIFINAYNTAAQGVMAWIGNSVADAQLALGSDPNSDSSVEPTHSQLSKDHAEHPLHDLAALLATEAVRQVTQAMTDHWEHKADADPIAAATAFFCHPADASWQYGVVEAWAENHPEHIKRASSKTDMDETHIKAIQELQGIYEQLTADSTRFLAQMFNNPDEQSSGLRFAEKALMKFLGTTSWGKAFLDFTKA